MNLEQYLKRKVKTSPENQRILCLDCFRSVKICFCKTINSFPTNTSFCILMHPMEARKERVGTGRLTKCCLQSCEIIIDKNFEYNQKVNKLINDPQYFPMLLYPGKNAHNITESNLECDLTDKKLLIFIIDGTWSCAKSMMRDSPNLHSLPRISFEASDHSLFDIKQQPAKYCLSTIESVYHLLNGLEKWNHEALFGKQTVLIETLKKLNDFQRACTMDPLKKGYRRGIFKSPAERTPSRKWIKRKICFEEKNY